MKRFLLAMMLATIGVAGLASAATAQEGAGVPTLTSANVAPGGTDDVSGIGCVARASVRVEFDDALLVTAQSDETGRYSARIVIPVSAVPGSHRVTVLCDGPNGPVVFRAQLSVGLPNTGSTTAPLVAFGALLLGLGCAVLAMTRRRGALRTIPVHRAGRTHALHRYEEKE